MAEYRIKDTILTRIANAVRRITGGSGKLPLSSIAEVLEDTSVVKTSDANATANDILNNKTAWINGEKIKGNIPIENEEDIIRLIEETGSSISFEFVDTSFNSESSYYRVSIPMSKYYRQGFSIRVINPELYTRGELRSLYRPSITVSQSRDDTLEISFPESFKAAIYTGVVIYADRPAGLTPNNIVSGVSIFGVEGTVNVQSYRHGTTEPDDSLGVDGDLYLVVEE